MTSTMEKLFAMVEEINNTLKEIKANQEELKASNEELRKELEEIKGKLTTEEPEETPVEEEAPATSQEQLNAFFNCMMNTMQSHADSQQEVGSPYNEYPGYSEPSSDKDIEAIAERLRQNAAAQDKLNSSNFSSLDNFDFEGTFGGKSSFNQNNERPPEQPVYHKVEPQVKQMNLDGMFHTQPTGNNWYGGNDQVDPNKQFHIGLSNDRQFLIFRRIVNGQNIAFTIARNSILWNTVVNKLVKENRKLSSLNNQELAELSDYACNMTAKGVDVFSPINQNIINQYNAVNNNNTQNDPSDSVLDTVDTAPIGMGYPQQGVSSPQMNMNIPNNQYNPTPMYQQPQQDVSRRNMGQNFYVGGGNNFTTQTFSSLNNGTNNMWAHYGEDIINNTSTINMSQQAMSPQQTNNVNFTNGGYTNPYIVKPVFGSSFNIY